MAQALHSYLLNRQNEIVACITVFGENDQECDNMLDMHIESGFDALNGESIDIYEEIAELPDREALQLVADAQIGDDDEDEEEDEDDPDAEDEEDDEDR